MHRASPFAILAAAGAFAALPSPTAAQCQLQWQQGDAVPFAHGNVRASTVWDPDGAGPAPAILVVGGRFNAGTMLDTPLAAFDGAAWSPLGTPPVGEVTALAVFNGQLVAAGGAGIQHTIASWNGTSWSVLATTDSAIRAMAVFGGSLFAGGAFARVNGLPMRCLAQWDGTQWSEPGGGIVGEVRAMTVFGSLYVGGAISRAGALAVGNLAIWNGTSWTAGAVFDDRIDALASRTGLTAAASFVLAGGSFTTVGATAALHVARFDAQTAAWSALPALPGTACTALHVRNIGSFTFQVHAAVEDNATLDKVWRLDSTGWTSLGAVRDTFGALPTSLAFFGGRYAVGLATMHLATEHVEKAVHLHGGTEWLPATGLGLIGNVYAAASFAGEAVIGGFLPSASGVVLNHIARGRAGAWQPLGGGVSPNGGVFALCTLANGDLVAAGDFTSAGGQPASRIARWNGSAWSPLAAGLGSTVLALLALPNGDLIAGGTFTTAGGAPANYVARWNGTAWAPLGAGTSAPVRALARLHGGDIVAAGSFVQAGGATVNRVARWNGATWSALGTGLDGVANALATLSNGDLVVGGGFATAGGVSSPFVARWDGASWWAQSSPAFAWDDDVHALLPLPDGDYLAAGPASFFGLGGIFGGTDASLARHVGGAASQSWVALDIAFTRVDAAAMLPDGDVLAGGIFDSAGGLASRAAARLHPTCPAIALPYGSGCTGSGGANVLAATELPWVGGAFRGRAIGLPPTAIALAVTGFAQLALPLAQVLPQGASGCVALAAPDLLEIAPQNGGIASTRLGLPNAPALAGLRLHHQVVPFELDTSGNITAVTSTNGLALTVGVF